MREGFITKGFRANAIESAPALLLVLDPTLNVIAVGDAHAPATMTVREHIVGHGIFENFSDNPR